jgi:YggT family protein
METFRWIVFGLFSYSAVVASASWLVRTKRINPFGKPARLLRFVSDPFLNPIETQLLKKGGNPQNASQWLLAGAVVGGIVSISMFEWLARQVAIIGMTGSTGPRGITRIVIFYAGQAFTISIFIRVIGSWVGAGRFNPLMKPFYLMTDWIIEPISKRIPPVGMIDLSPIIAYFGMQFLVSFLLRSL